MFSGPPEPERAGGQDKWTALPRPRPLHADLRDAALEAIDRAVLAPHSEVNVEARSEEEKRIVEVRCPKNQCGCSPRGKLIATLIDVPASLLGSGAVLQAVCPSKKSRLLRIRL